MSSTNRGAERRPDDRYYTPAWCVHRLLDAWMMPPGLAVEPAVGDGAIVRAVESHRQSRVEPRRWECGDIDVQHRQKIEEMAPGRITFTWRDYMVGAILAGRAEVKAVITNPPYSLAEEFIQRARVEFPQASIAMLLRLSFLASAKRASLWQDVGLPDVYVLPNRPSFTGGKTDSCDYAWFVWEVPKLGGVNTRGRLTVLATTPASERNG